MYLISLTISRTMNALFKYLRAGRPTAQAIADKSRFTQTSQNNVFTGFRAYSTDINQISIPIVSYEEVKDLPNHPEKLLIDVREPSELESGVIPSSINIPLGEVDAALNLSDQQFKLKYKRSKPGTNDEVIFHCRVGMRSENAAIAATKLGYTKAKNYKGSWLEWAEREGLTK